jgi:hypothetical protein
MSDVEYLQYHNVHKRGRWPVVDCPKLAIYWSANRTVPVGARVWLVVGEKDGRKTRYWLRYWFIVDEHRVENGLFVAAGADGQVFEPPVEIGNTPWFPEFLGYMGNFGRGVSSLRSLDVDHFESAVVDAPSSHATRATR